MNCYPLFLFAAFAAMCMFLFVSANRFYQVLHVYFFWICFCCWEDRCLHFDTPGDHFGTSGAPLEAMSTPRDHLGEPWEQQHEHEVVRNKIFIDFGVLLGPMYISLYVFKKLETSLCSGLFPGHVFHWFPNRHLDVWGSKFDVFAKNVLLNKIFTKIVCHEFRHRNLSFVEALEAVFSNPGNN